MRQTRAATKWKELVTRAYITAEVQTSLWVSVSSDIDLVSIVLPTSRNIKSYTCPFGMTGPLVTCTEG